MKAELLMWASAIMAALLVFSICIMFVGYQPLTIGRAMTVLMLAVGSTACFIAYRKRR